nr:hypothetical protein [Tanacetum cinerariifolium]
KSTIDKSSRKNNKKNAVKMNTIKKGSELESRAQANMGEVMIDEDAKDAPGTEDNVSSNTKIPIPVHLNHILNP